MHWIVYVSLIFGLFLTIMGGIIIGSANKLKVDKNDVHLRNIKNSGYGILTTGILLLVASIIAFLMKYKVQIVSKISKYSEDSIPAPIEMTEFKSVSMPPPAPRMNVPVPPPRVPSSVPVPPPRVSSSIPVPPPSVNIPSPPPSVPGVSQFKIPTATRKFPVAKPVQQFGVRKYHIANRY